MSEEYRVARYHNCCICGTACEVSLRPGMGALLFIDDSTGTVVAYCTQACVDLKISLQQSEDTKK